MKGRILSCFPRNFLFPRWTWMKHLGMSLILLAGFVPSKGQAQRVAIVDVQEVLRAMPEYQQARKTLDSLSRTWKAEIEEMYREIDRMWRQYREERYLLTEEMRRQREDEIMQMEKQVREKQRKYFGPEGELAKTQERLLKPLYDRIYQAIREVAMEKRYNIVIDRSARGSGVVYVESRYNITREVKKKLGIR